MKIRLALTFLGIICSAHAATQTFDYTGAEQQFIVPAGVTSITVTAHGAKGGNGYNASSGGGLGGTTTATISVTPGETLAILVGGMGGNGVIVDPMNPGASGGAG